jgi:hypothetical protein
LKGAERAKTRSPQAGVRIAIVAYARVILTAPFGWCRSHFAATPSHPRFLRLRIEPDAASGALRAGEEDRLMHAFGLSVAVLAVSLVASGSGTAQAAGSKCDAGITKAAGKKVYCKAKVNSTAQKKGTTPDSTKLAKCEDKFNKACTKAQASADCSAQTQTCAQIETEADTCVTAISSGSPSAAFLE